MWTRGLSWLAVMAVLCPALAGCGNAGDAAGVSASPAAETNERYSNERFSFSLDYRRSEWILFEYDTPDGGPWAYFTAQFIDRRYEGVSPPVGVTVQAPVVFPLAEYQPGVLRPGVPRPDDPSDAKELKASLKATIANAKLADKTGVMVHKDAHTGETSGLPSMGFTTEWTLNGTPVRAVHTYVFGPVQTWSMSMMAPVAEWPEVEAGFRELMNSFRPG